jgi:PTS system galactitol-specific IIA component
MQFKDLIKKDLIFTDCDFQNAEEVISFLSMKLHDKGLVKDSFSIAVKEREMVYPTGLNLGHVCIAVPHTDVEHVQIPAVTLAIMKSPVLFISMEDCETPLPVKIVACLAMEKAEYNVKLLPEVIRFFSQEKITTKILNSASSEEIFQLITEERGVRN